jgi:hypothetical protein
MRQETTFETGAIFWHELENKAYAIRKVGELLDKNIRLTDYGTGIVRFVFVPIAVLPSNKIHEEKISYSKAKREITLYLKLDYAAAAAADETAFQQLVAQLFLRGIDEAPQSRIRDFDWARFRRDVERVLGGGQL